MTSDLDQRINDALERGKRETAKRNAVLNRWLLRQGRMTIRDKQDARAAGYREGYSEGRECGLSDAYDQQEEYATRYDTDCEVEAPPAPKPRLRTRLWRWILGWAGGRND